MMFKGVTHHTQKCQEPVTPKLITWCRTRSAEMPTLLHPSQPITWGHLQNAEMPLCYRPHQFTRCQIVHAEMLLKVRTKGKGQRHNTEMSIDCRPSQPITGGQTLCAEMPCHARPHQIWANRRAQQCQNPNAQITPTRGQSRSAK